MSSPESDYDIAAGDSAMEHDVPSRRPTRASSDPSIAAVDNVPHRPVEPPPAPPRPEMQPRLGYDPRYVCTTHVATLLLVSDLWQLCLYILAQSDSDPLSTKITCSFSRHLVYLFYLDNSTR